MEVFMHNLPRDLTEPGLKSQLEPFMLRLSIINYLCDKPKKKPFGYITFLDQSDGQRFLIAHEQQTIPNITTAKGHPRRISRLKLMGSDVFCTLSKKNAQDFALRSLQHVADQRGKQVYEVEEEDPAITFQMLSFSCGFYSFVGEDLAYTPEVLWGETGTVKFKKRNVIVKGQKGLVRIPHSTVVGFVWSRDGSLTLTMSTVPLFLSNVKDLGADSRTSQSRLCFLSESHAKVVGHCLVYQFQVSCVDLHKKVQQLKEWEAPIAYCELIHGRADLRMGSSSLQLKALMDCLSDLTTKKLLPFEILFQLQALAYNAYLHPKTVLRLALELARIFKADSLAGRKSISVDAMKKLLPLIDWPFPGEDPQQFEVQPIIDLLKENEREIQKGFAYRGGLVQGRNLARISRVMVTPTRITLHGGEMEPNNRILRKFPNNQDCFIRAQFCDENGENLYFNPRVSYDGVFARFKDVMKNGIQIAGRTYSFLGFSHSSLRAHSVWFCCPFMDDNGHFQTHFTIIKAIGNLSHITSPAKYAARIGQAFSETPFTVPLIENDIYVSELPDVKSADGSRVFSDGVGTISYSAVQSIWSSVPKRKGNATCFQIRFGGSKDMLALNSQLPGSLIQLRPSMTKFDSDDIKDLEICDMGTKPIPLVLNRQMIKILEDMGVSDKWFFRLQTEEIEHLRNITASAFTIARFFRHHNIGSPIGLHRIYHQSRHLGLDYKNEPFLCAVVEAVILRELRLLKHKARIPVKKGITLFGIMDETGFLKENEVYVTFDTMDGRHLPPPRQGRIVVTRSPALHNGDIQFATNVVPPAVHPLRSHRNCIVFSQKGERDLPSQLSGGDLDGDLYNIIWDPEATPLQVFKPADYPRVDPLNIGRSVTAEDMADFFVEFMKTDHLGVIATRHMVFADQEPEGTCHPNCKKIAELHSTAVDFSKTGIPASMNELPRGNSFRPDFMAPGPQTRIYNKSEIDLDEYIYHTAFDEDEDSEPRRKYYRSDKVLGKLYRAVDERKIWHEDVKLRPTTSDGSFWKGFIDAATRKCEAIGPIKWTHQAESAECIKKAYEDSMVNMMNSFSEHPINPITELEVFVGYLINKAGVQTARQRDQSIKLKDEFERIAAWITKMMRRDHSKPLTGYEQEFDSLALCLACVHVGCKGGRVAGRRRRDGYNGLGSFKVIAACALLGELEYYEKAMRSGGYVGMQGEGNGLEGGWDLLSAALPGANGNGRSRCFDS